MDLDDQICFEHLLFYERKCRSCGQIKNLLDDFYLIRKNKSSIESSYSYECKKCNIKRVIEKRKSKNNEFIWEYPDW